MCIRYATEKHNLHLFMFKDFQKWHTLKKNIDTSHDPPLFSEREIWWSSIGVNVGSEINGKHELFERPVLIVKKLHQEIFLGLPLTSKEKRGKYYMQIPFHKRNRIVILSQIRVFSSKRLIRKMGKIGKPHFYRIKRALSRIYW